MSTRRLRPALAAGVALLAAQAAAAQGSLARRVEAAPDGDVRFSFAAREGVCGYEHGIGIREHRRAGRTTIYHGDFSAARGEWEDEDCVDGPVYLSLRVADGRVGEVEVRVARPFRDRGARVTELGRVGTAEAARYLVSLAERSGGKVGEEALFPATLADSVTLWPELLRLARTESPRARRSATFWLGQAATEAVTRSVRDPGGDDAGREVRKKAVFALSQRPRDEGIPELLRVARTHRDPEVRGAALFGLGQSGDPRALDLFEEILRGRN
ncbi:MAG TPA: HEAT repeat domain-containing protein [Longimicrobiaceae bacterium]|nr:HEAT repeat domain-containing protein [Longimicrobiaceae bacterium]